MILEIDWTLSFKNFFRYVLRNIVLQSFCKTKNSGNDVRFVVSSI